MSTFYHYTDGAGIKGIMSDRRILPSVRDPRKPRRDVAIGEGVYFTRLSPKTPKTKIASNNYDGVIRRSGYSDRIMYCVVVRFTGVALNGMIKMQNDRRDVWCLRVDRDGGLDLDDGDLVEEYTFYDLGEEEEMK